MQDTLQQQLDISKGLLEALDRMVNSFEIMLGRTSMQQSNMSNDLNRSMQKADDSMDQAASTASKMSRQMSQSNAEGEYKDVVKSTKGFSRIINNSLKRTKAFFKKSALETLKNSEIAKSLKSSTKEINNNLKNKTAIVSEALNKAATRFKTLKFIIRSSKWIASMLGKAIGAIAMVKDAFLTGGLSLLKDIPKLIFSVLKSLFNVFTSLIGAATKFFTFSLTLPFTISKFAASIGNKIRTELVEVIQTAGEEAKESFDLTSHIGQSAAKLTNMSKGLLKAFQSPRTRLSKLFGMGAQGAARFLTETFKAVDGMGHYAEFFGQSLLGSVESGQYLIEMQRAMGLGQKEMAYYAMEAFNSGKHPVDVLHDTSTLLKEAADNNDLDFKALTKGFNTLRTNIVDFGHMSSNEIKNLVVKLRKMKVKTDDAVSVFKKFTTLEEASKASAMLFQSFNMNIDAFDLLNSRNPGEMLQQFRDAMFETGRSFKDLNRHEKALLSSTIGISENGLKSLMNYMDVGLTYDQAKKKMEEQDPSKQQIKMIKGLTSTIKLFQKTMEFKSPFDAFFQGLTKNMSMHNKLKSSTISLSKIYEDFFHLGLNFNTNELNAMLLPIANVLKKISETLTGPGFKNTIQAATSAAGNLLSGVAYDLNDKKSKEMIKFTKKIQSSAEFFKKDADKLNETKASALNTILESVSGDTEIDNLMIKALVKQGVITNSKKFGPQLAKNITLKKASEAFLTLKNQFSSSSAATKKINEIFNKVEQKFNEGLTTLDESQYNALNSHIQNSTRIKARIDSFYDKLSNMFTKGKKGFKNIVDIGGNLMGTIVRGIMTGIAAAFKIFSGSSDMTAESLGIKIDKETLEKLKAEGKSPKDYTIFDWLSFSKEDRDVLAKELGDASSETVGYLPDFVGLAGSFLGDLTEVFVEFAFGIAGFAGDVMLEYYESSNFITRGMLRGAGFNPQEAYKLVSRSKGEYKSTSTSKGFDGQKLLSAISNEDGSFKESYVGTFVDAYEEMLNTSVKGSPIHQFLNSQRVRTQAAYVSDRDNFKFFDSFNYFLDDYDEPQRAQAMLNIIDKAYQVNTSFPQESYAKYLSMKENLSQEKRDKIEKEIIEAYKLGNTLRRSLPQNYSIGNALGFSAGFGNDDQDVTKKLTEIQENLYSVKSMKRQDQLKSLISVNDTNLEGKESIMFSKGKLISFHNEDVIASKPKGWLNTLFVKVSDYYNDIYENVANSYTALKIEDDEKIKTNCLALKKSIINKDDTDQVSESEMSNLFGLSMEVVSLFVNRDIVSKKVNAKFER